jgi:hypothetical protein
MNEQLLAAINEALGKLFSHESDVDLFDVWELIPLDIYPEEYMEFEVLIKKTGIEGYQIIDDSSLFPRIIKLFQEK